MTYDKNTNKYGESYACKYISILSKYPFMSECLLCPHIYFISNFWVLLFLSYELLISNFIFCELLEMLLIDMKIEVIYDTHHGWHSLSNLYCIS